MPNKPIKSWEVIDRAAPFGNPLKTLRISVMYPDGNSRVLPPAFANRITLDRYVGRYHPDFAGKEIVNGNGATVET